MFINYNNDYFNLDKIKGFKLIEPMQVKLYFVDGTCKTFKANQKYIDDLILLTLGDSKDYSGE
mgnify:CR=1 FL=1